MSDRYLFTIETILKSLNTSIVLLEKANSWKQEVGKTDEEILQTRLAPDMLPFHRQVTILSDNAKGAAFRLAGKVAPKMEDTETTLKELAERLKKTREVINEIDQQEYNHAHEQKIVLPFMPDKYQTAEDYVRDYAIPNFFFHMVTMYAILRHLGMPLGKADFIGGVVLNDL